MKNDISKTKFIVNLVTGLISIIIAVLIFVKVIPVSEALYYIIGIALLGLGLYYSYTAIRGLIEYQKDSKEE